jgi:hypothetical protein
LVAYTYIAGLLESYNGCGHFLIPTNYIGTPRFLTAPQIRKLRRRGHVIGSYSCSPANRMAQCHRKILIEEWTGSAKIHSDLASEPVIGASVPGGQYSRKVAEAACFAGIKVLFTSEPVTQCYSVDECMALGRYSILGGMPVSVAAGQAGGRLAPRLKQSVFWNLKKVAQCLGGEFYSSVRTRALEQESQAERRLKSPSHIDS